MARARDHRRVHRRDAGREVLLSRLAELQRLFVASVYGAAQPAFVAAVTGGGKLKPAEAVEVYRRGYPARLSEALGETFEACWRVLGDEDFLAACADFCRLEPSVSHNLSDYGRNFPEFLRARHGDHAPFIADLARLEWEFKEIFHKAPHRGLAASELAAKATEKSVFAFGAAVSLARFDHRVAAIWRRDRSDGTPIAEKDWKGEECLVLFKRGNDEVFVLEVERPSFHVLAALKAGKTLERALESSEGLKEDAVSSLFRFVAENGLVEGVS